MTTVFTLQLEVHSNLQALSFSDEMPCTTGIPVGVRIPNVYAFQLCYGRLTLTVHEIRRSNIAKLSRQNLRSSYSGNFMATLRSQRLNSMSIHTSNDRSRELKFISYMKISSLVRRNIIVINYN